MCPRKVIRVYSGCQGEHIQQILKLLSSPRQPFVGQGRKRQVPWAVLDSTVLCLLLSAAAVTTLFFGRVPLMDYLLPCLNTPGSIWRNSSHRHHCSFWWRITQYPTHSMRTPRRKPQSCVPDSFPENAPQRLQDQPCARSKCLLRCCCDDTMIKSDSEGKGFISSNRLQPIIGDTEA